MKLKYIILTFFVVVFFQCKTTKMTPTSDTKRATVKTIEIIKRDTIIQVKQDSSFYRSLIKCIDGKPLLKIDSVFIEKTKYIKPPSIILKGDTIRVFCQTEAQELFLQWKEKFISEQTESHKTITLPPVEIERELSWWQKLWIAMGRIALIILIIYLATRVSWGKNL